MRLYVNIDHVATVREARRTDEPDPLRAAELAERGGADGITVHLREDRRHIQDADVRALARRLGTVLNLELAAHGLTYQNVRPVAAIPELEELNIGHSIVSNALYWGLEDAVRRMRKLVDDARE